MTVSPAQSATPQPSEKTLNPCDLVMKGGITSGIVYPPALLQLKDQYKFRNIGGTSAGAIAAAGAAAAEFRRNDGGGNAGFDYLDKNVQQWLGTSNNLLNLFQASAATKPLLDFMLALLPTPPASAANSASQSKPPTLQTTQKPNPLQPVFKLLRTWLVNYFPISLGAFLWAIVAILFFASLPLAVFAVVYLVSPTSAAQSATGFTIVAMILGIVGAWLGWHIGGVISAVLKLRGNFYGICTGHATKPDSALDFTNLTDWLSKVFNEMAGKDLTVPLTFGDLTGKGDLKDKGITLKMVTSNLSHGLPYVMPEGLQNFIFKKSEMLKLFPEYVVHHMVGNQPKEPLIPQDKLPQLPAGEEDGYYYLPDEDQLPVIVCTRMSLCFPILLSAVPLYTISTQAYDDLRKGKLSKLEADSQYKHLQLNWFSDGGVCSNFPVQFFDAWLPRWPTFGINLTSLSRVNSTSVLQKCDEAVQSAAATAREKDPEPVYLPKAEDRQDPEWNTVDGLLSFALAIFGTAQNYRDTMQANLPSYRERIVQIRLNDEEGGLHLAMPEDIIKKVVGKGCEAGMTLCNPKEFDLDHHIWVRFLVLMAQLEQNIINMQEVLKSPDFEDRLQQQLKLRSDPQFRYPYWKDEDWTSDVRSRITALRNLINDWTIDPLDKVKNKPCFFGQDAPLPQPVLRVTPEV